MRLLLVCAGLLVLLPLGLYVLGSVFADYSMLVDTFGWWGLLIPLLLILLILIFG